MADDDSSLLVTLPAVNQPLTFDDFPPFAAAAYHQKLNETFQAQNANTSYTLPRSSPTQSLMSHSLESDWQLDMNSSHGPSTPDHSWNPMLASPDPEVAGADNPNYHHHHSWNAGMPPYYDPYSAPTDATCNTFNTSQIAHLGAVFDNHPPTHYQYTDELLASPSPSAACPYPPFPSMAPLTHESHVNHYPVVESSNIPRNLINHPDLFSPFLLSPDNDAAHSSPSSFAQDDVTSTTNTTNTRASSVSISLPHSTRRRESARQRRQSPCQISAATSQPILPYSASSATIPSTMRPLVPTSNTPECSECRLTFRDMPALQKHVKSEHTRPLLCVFHYAGCQSRFASKNEWKRHVSSQHLALRYWLCTVGSCSHTRGPSTRSRAPSLPQGNIFNRKDLYTQHIRRMHLTTSDDSHGLVRVNSKKPAPTESEERMRELHANAAHIRCSLPDYMLCPAPGCLSEFHGANAWDDRMEHVAGHLERAATGEEAPVVFGGPNDWTLTQWAEKEGVNVTRLVAPGVWKLCSPLKGETGAGTTTSPRTSRCAHRKNSASRKKAAIPRSVASATVAASVAAAAAAFTCSALDSDATMVNGVDDVDDDNNNNNDAVVVVDDDDDDVDDVDGDDAEGEEYTPFH